MPQSIVADLRNADIEGLGDIQSGRVVSASVVTADERANPSVAWFALEHRENVIIGSKARGLTWFELEEINRFSTAPKVVINQAFADELEVVKGDELQLGWFVRNQNGIERVEQNFSVEEVVEMAGQGQLAGTTTPAVFTDLATAQVLQQSEGNVTSIRISLDGVKEQRSAVEPIIDSIGETLNQSIGVDESGLQLITEGDALTVASTNGLGRLSPRIVTSLSENRSSLVADAALMEVLQVPLIGLDSGSSNLLTLADGDVDGILVDDGALWHWGAAGLGFETNETSWIWRVPSGGILNDVSIDGGLGFAAHDEGLVLGNVSDDEETSFIIEDKQMVAVVSESTSWFALEDGTSRSLWYGDVDSETMNESPLELDLPSTILDWGLRMDDINLYLRVEGLLSESFFMRSLDNLQQPFVEMDASEWPLGTSEQPEVCPGLGVELNTTQAWCIEDSGLVLRSTENESIQSMRLPILSDAGGFGTLPQMFFAFDGDCLLYTSDAADD